MRNELNIFLLIGQSNMAGRGRLDEVPTLRDPQVSMFRYGRWTVAEEPLHTDKPDIAGVGLGMSFAIELLAHNPGTSIGLVPCAVGGTPLSRWMPEADLYENAVSVTRLALPKGTLSGILWHQGERDSRNPDDANSYGKRFQQMVVRMQMDLSAAHVPVVAGELGSFLQDRDEAQSFTVVNQQLWELERSLPVYGCVSSKGLSDNGDKLHFNAESLREFGRRYARRYIELTGKSSKSEPEDALDA
jgi:hypothetical protein